MEPVICNVLPVLLRHILVVNVPTDVSIRWTDTFAPDIFRALELKKKKKKESKIARKDACLGSDSSHASTFSCCVLFCEVCTLLNFPIRSSLRTGSTGRLSHHRVLRIGTSLVAKETEAAWGCHSESGVLCAGHTASQGQASTLGPTLVDFLSGGVGGQIFSQFCLNSLG